MNKAPTSAQLPIRFCIEKSVFLLSTSVCFVCCCHFDDRLLATHCSTGAELSTLFGTSLIMPKCLGSEVSGVRSVLTPFQELGSSPEAHLARMVLGLGLGLELGLGLGC